MITIADFECIEQKVKLINRYLNFKYKIEILEYDDGTFRMINFGPSDECNDSFHFIDYDVPEIVTSLDEVIKYCNYMIENDLLSMD